MIIDEYQYQELVMPVEAESGEMIHILNTEGAKGWQVVSEYRGLTGHRFLMMREARLG